MSDERRQVQRRDQQDAADVPRRRTASGAAERLVRNEREGGMAAPVPGNDHP